MSDIHLSICIPTFNRAEYLRDALESIHSQLKADAGLMEGIEVVVADNDSTDNTESVVKEYADKFTHFNYLKNPTNVGFDKNVDIVVRGASGRYCWHLGDDDAIINGAIEHILELCRTDQYSIITVSDEPLENRPLLVTSQESYSESDQISNLTPTECYTRGYLPSALSMLIFRRKNWLEQADFSTHTPGWYYFEVILKIAAEEGYVLRINKPMILTGQDMRWADGGEGLKIFIDCNKFLFKMSDWGYDQKIIGAEINSNIRKFPYVLLQAKSRGLPMSLTNLALIKSFTTHTPIYIRLVSVLIFFVPNPIVRLIRSIKKRVV